MTKFIFITGGVVSSLGKGVVAGALGSILKSCDLNITVIKLDPYINVDPGTMTPFQHGEVFVTDDGTEADLDLGHYERFLNISMSKENNFTSGKVYDSVIKREREGGYLGQTVQVIPHITNEIKERIIAASNGFDIAIVEVGGTVGDIESLPFIETARQIRISLGMKNTAFIHLTLVPYIKVSQESKTKPTQHSVKELRSIGIQPDILVCRSEEELNDEQRDKISLFTNVVKDSVITLPDLKSIYEIPTKLSNQNLEKIVLEQFGLNVKNSDTSAWDDLVQKQDIHKYEINLGIIGKYVKLGDAYKSLTEAIKHASMHTNTKINISYVESESLENEKHEEILQNFEAILVPGGFGTRGVEGKLRAIKYARENKIPFFGICFGMQLATIEYARAFLNLPNPTSEEFDKEAKDLVIWKLRGWAGRDGNFIDAKESTRLGGSLRVGAFKTHFEAGSKIAEIYDSNEISERHRHRFGVNPKYVSSLQTNGLIISGLSVGDKIVESIELKDHPWFIAVQAHPEFTSRPISGHPLFTSFINAAVKVKYGN